MATPKIPELAQPLSEAFMDNLKVEITSKLATTQSLLDKLDTSTWDAKDLEVFDMLVAEKRQVEKDHHKLASGAGRAPRQIVPADLKQAASDWRYDTETAGYIYVGNNTCALDRSHAQQCHHDICKEAKSKEGLSYLEYDTIIHYNQRIANAKTHRMRSALQKQRDIQLAKDKEACQEWKEKAIKKFKYLGKDACDALLAMAHQFDKTVTLPLLAPPERPDNAVELVGLALSKLRINSLTERERHFLHTAIEMLATTDATREKNSYHWRDHTALFEYFKDVEWTHLEGAMMNVRDALALNSVITYELDYGLRQFSEELQILMRNLDRDTRTKPGLTVKEGLLKMLHHIKDADRDVTFHKGCLYYALVQCSVVDAAVKDKMLKISDANPVLTGQKFYEALDLARKEETEKSPLPAITNASTEAEYQRCQQRGLIHHIIDSLNAANKKETKEASRHKIQLHNRLIDIFKQTMINKGIAEYKQSAKRLALALEDFKKGREYPEVCAAIDAAQKIALQSIANVEADEEQTTLDLDFKTNKVAMQLYRLRFEVQLLPGVDTEDSGEMILKYAKGFYDKQKMFDVVRPYLWRGASEFFLAFTNICICEGSLEGAPYIPAVDICHLTENLESHLKTFTKEGDGLETFLRDRYNEGWCLAKIMIRLAILLSHLSAYNQLTAKNVLSNMMLLAKFGTTVLPASWLPSFRGLSRSIVQTYGYLMFEFTRVMGRADVDQFVLTCVWILFICVLVADSGDSSAKQSVRGVEFVRQVLNLDEDHPTIEVLKDIFEDTVDFIDVRCEQPHTCGDDSGPRTPTTATLSQRVQPAMNGLRPMRLASYSRALVEITSSQHFDESAAGQVLKYIALRLRPELRAYLTAHDLECLWHAFARSEVKLWKTPGHALDRPDASSMHLGMHNGCNIWELFASEQKACGFFEGYTLGYRDTTDIETVLKSLVYYAFNYGSGIRARRKVQELFVPHIYPESLFDLFAQKIKDLELFFEECSTEDKIHSLEAQTYMNRLDHLLATGIGVRDPRYLRALQRYCDFVFGEDAELSSLVSGVLKDLTMGTEVSEDDKRYNTMAVLWHDIEAEHIDIIYSDDDDSTDTEEKDSGPFTLQPPKTRTKFDQNSDSDSSYDEADSLCESETCSQRMSMDSNGDLRPAPRKLRPVSDLAEPVVSAINATAHTKRRSIITIKSPEVACRGRDTHSQAQPNRSVRDRSPTPFPRLPDRLKTSDESFRATQRSLRRARPAPSPAVYDETTVPELQLDIGDAASDYDPDSYSPFEAPTGGERPNFYAHLSLKSKLLKQMDGIRNLMVEIKSSLNDQDHPLRAMHSSQDEEERQRTVEMFEQAGRWETQMMEFQESLGVFEYRELERAGKLPPRTNVKYIYGSDDESLSREPESENGSYVREQPSSTHNSVVRALFGQDFDRKELNKIMLA